MPSRLFASLEGVLPYADDAHFFKLYGSFSKYLLPSKYWDYEHLAGCGLSHPNQYVRLIAEGFRDTTTVTITNDRDDHNYWLRNSVLVGRRSPDGQERSVVDLTATFTRHLKDRPAVVVPEAIAAFERCRDALIYGIIRRARP